jgi:hypothetical protein
MLVLLEGGRPALGEGRPESARDLRAEAQSRVERANLTEISDNQSHVRKTAGQDEVIAAVR